MPGRDEIQHVVVLMMENRSFDHLLGCFQSTYPRLEGVDPRNFKSNKDRNGINIPQNETLLRRLPDDPKHEYINVEYQLNGNLNDNFVRDYSYYYNCDNRNHNWGAVMEYYRNGALPALHHLAQNFTICDHWFSSVPGPTWPNRFFVHSGTSKGYVQMGADHLHWYNQRTIYDELNDYNIPWKIYYGDIPQSLLLTRQLWPKNLCKYSNMNSFFNDVNNHPTNEFPTYCFIEPTYYISQMFSSNDDHPPSDIMDGQALINNIYNALRANPELWRSTLLIITYDEHGGFYDHVSPPQTVSPDGLYESFLKTHHGLQSQKLYEFKFDRLGVRVPTLLVSPWLNSGFSPEVFDHTSILKFLINKWCNGNHSLGNRVNLANDLPDDIFRAQMRNDIDDFIMPNNLELGEELILDADNPYPLSNHQKGMIRYLKDLEGFIKDEQVRSQLFQQEEADPENPVTQWEVARNRAKALINQAYEVMGMNEDILL